MSPAPRPRSPSDGPMPVPPRTPVGQALVGLTDSQRLALAAKQRVEHDAQVDPEAAAEKHSAALMFIEFRSEYHADKEINRRVLAAQDAALERIEGKQDLTNGRVTSLESSRSQVYWTVAGAAAVLSVLGWLVAAQLAVIFKDSVRQIIREEINAPAHIEKIKDARLEHRRNTELAEHP